MKRTAIICGIGLAVVIGAGLLWWFSDLAPRRRLAAENYPQVRMGMSQPEVEELFGGPPGNYGRYVDGTSMMTMEGYFSPAGSVERIWCDDEHRFEIYFDAAGHVVGHHRRAGYSQSAGEGFLGWLRRVTGI